MKRLFFLLLACALAHPLRAASDDEVAARNAVLSIVGAFSNDGFKLRDGNWTGVIHPKESLVIQVNLYAGNQYWFSVGATGKAKKIAVAVFDETGKPVETDKHEDGAKTAAGFAPGASGSYYVRIQEPEGDAATFCLVYSYK
jgi:hypothetical protein